jgi:hypothetical protein
MVFQAGLVSFFRTLLIIAGIYFGLRLLFRILIPFLLKRFVRKQQEQFYNDNSFQNGREEGEIKVKSKREKRSSNTNLGEYIDYEEIQEKENNKDG